MEPYPITTSSLDGTHTHRVRIAPGTDWLRCKCGSCTFAIAFAKFIDHSAGVIAECQECGRVLELQKD